VRLAAGRLPWAAARGLAFGAVLALLFLTPLSPAAAHDVIEAAEPADGSVLASVPAAVKLTFNNTPIALGAAVVVQDQNGVDQSEGGALIIDNHVAQAVKAGAPAGHYTVTWRVVSSDSHPIEGRFTFTVTGTAGSSSSATSPVSAAPAAGGEPAAAAGAPWALVAGGSVIVAGQLAIARSVRRRLREDNGGAS
jgi:copper resistance protein C